MRYCVKKPLRRQFSLSERTTSHCCTQLMLSRSSSNLSIAVVFFPQNFIQCPYYSPVEPKFYKAHTLTYECAYHRVRFLRRNFGPVRNNRRRCAVILLIISQGQLTTVPLLIILKTLFRLSKVISLDLYKCILSGAMKFVSRVRSS